MHQSNANEVTCTSNIGKNITPSQQEKNLDFSCLLGHINVLTTKFLESRFKFFLSSLFCLIHVRHLVKNSKTMVCSISTTFPYQPSWRFRNEEKTKCQNDTRDKSYKHLTKKVSCYFFLILGSWKETVRNYTNQC